MPTPRTILFAGGGTGGHIYPNLAIWQRLLELRPQAKAHFLVSNRAVDAQIMAKEALPYTALPALPLAMHPLKLLKFYKAFKASEAIVGQIIRDQQVLAIVTTGGFVSGPAAAAAVKANIPILMVNLDAIPGKANQWIARRATELYTAYPHHTLSQAAPIGLPLRRSAIGPKDQRQARRILGLDPDKPMLLVTGASLGAQSINLLMRDLAVMAPFRKALEGWQILHLTGKDGAPEAEAVYKEMKLDAHVQTFCNQMGCAWRGATLAISRCGAGSVAEVWANATPTIFLPYPHHRDQHQKFNAQPLVDAGAAMMYTDLIDPMANARQLCGPLTALMGNDAQRQRMVDIMQSDAPPDGAQTIADWLAKMI